MLSRPHCKYRCGFCATCGFAPRQAFLQRHWPRPQICASVLLVVAGCVIAGMGDLGFDARGYGYALLSCTMQAAYLLVVEFQVGGQGRRDAGQRGSFAAAASLTPALSWPMPLPVRVRLRVCVYVVFVCACVHVRVCCVCVCVCVV